MPIIKTVKGDLLEMFNEGEFDGIMHGCNCMHFMGAGIAGQIARAYPYVRDADLNTIKGPSKIGSFSLKKVPGCGFIINAYTQVFPGPDFSLNALEGVLGALKPKVEYWMKTGWNDRKEDRFLMGIPMIGAGIGGGDWSQIYKLIDEKTPYMDVVVVEWNKS